MLKRKLLQILCCDSCRARFELRLAYGEPRADNIARRKAEQAGWHCTLWGDFCPKCYKEKFQTDETAEKHP